MEECRLVIHEGTLDKCKRLGIASGEECDDEYPCLVIKKDVDDGKLKYYYYPVDDYVGFLRDLPEITNKDFLALPEPFKIGDWVKFKCTTREVIFKIHRLNREDQCFWSNMDDRYFDLDHCTKLTPEQIKILGVE